MFVVRKESADTQEYESCQLSDMDEKEELSFIPSAVSSSCSTPFASPSRFMRCSSDTESRKRNTKTRQNKKKGHDDTTHTERKKKKKGMGNMSQTPGIGAHTNRKTKKRKKARTTTKKQKHENTHVLSSVTVCRSFSFVSCYDDSVLFMLRVVLSLRADISSVSHTVFVLLVLFASAFCIILSLGFLSVFSCLLLSLGIFFVFCFEFCFNCSLFSSSCLFFVVSFSLVDRARGFFFVIRFIHAEVFSSSQDWSENHIRLAQISRHQNLREHDGEKPRNAEEALAALRAQKTPARSCRARLADGSASTSRDGHASWRASSPACTPTFDKINGWRCRRSQMANHSTSCAEVDLGTAMRRRAGRARVLLRDLVS